MDSEKLRKYWIIFPIVSIIFIIFILFGAAINYGVITIGSNSISESLNNSEKKTVEIELIIDYGDGTVYNSEFVIRYSTVYDVLKEAAHREGFSVEETFHKQYDSYFIESINNYQNGEDNRYWVYYLNDVYGTVGSDKQIVKNGDIVKWRFEKYLE